MGLSGSGKSRLAADLHKRLVEGGHSSVRFNGDNVRREHNNFDFSEGGRLKQCLKMKELAQKASKNFNFVISDFICPTHKLQLEFGADYLVYMNTINFSQHPSTDKIFEAPLKPNIETLHKDADYYSWMIFNKIIKENK
jgi:hypothetical protein